MTPDELAPALPTIETRADERLMLRQFLDYFRAVLERKASGLTAEQLRTPVAPSNLTLGGLLLHMAGAEEGWFSECFLDRPLGDPWTEIDWDATPDWELENVDRFTPDEMFGCFRPACERSRLTEAEAESLDLVTAKDFPNERQWSLRWIMVHMIEEYARHCGHADFIRQAIDGTVGD
ncbi:MAG: DinB family protein [Acidimicrobiia bacterium]|nr:DinB family protein [Acidimicrobiia bacterium]